MADTVKTQVMKALESALRAEVPEVKAVERREPIGTDLETAKLPTLFLYSEDESGKERHNRHARGIIPVEMAVFIRLKPGKDYDQGFRAEAETIAAQVYMVMHGPSFLASPVLRVEEYLKRLAIGNESFGELVLRYRITYGHALNDPFSAILL